MREALEAAANSKRERRAEARGTATARLRATPVAGGLTLDEMAERIHAARNTGMGGGGAAGGDSRSTTAVVRTIGGQYYVSTQRKYSEMDTVAATIAEACGITFEGFLTPKASGRDDEGNIRAEMIAVARRLAGDISRFSSIGVSKPICSRCAAVLRFLNVAMTAGTEGETQNWVNPYYLVDMATPEGLDVPDSVSRGNEYRRSAAATGDTEMAAATASSSTTTSSTTTTTTTAATTTTATTAAAAAAAVATTATAATTARRATTAATAAAATT